MAFKTWPSLALLLTCIYTWLIVICGSRYHTCSITPVPAPRPSCSHGRTALPTMACWASQAIAKHSGDVFIPRGVDVPALDRSISYEFAPQKVKVRRRAQKLDRA